MSKFNNIFSKGGSVTINGVTIKSSNGGSVRVEGNDIYVDGESINLSDFGDTRTFNIVIEGSVESVSNTSGDVTIMGDAGKVKTMSGDANISGDVTGDVGTMSGDVQVKGSINGSVKTMSGDIKR